MRPPGAPPLSLHPTTLRLVVQLSLPPYPRLHPYPYEPSPNPRVQRFFGRPISRKPSVAPRDEIKFSGARSLATSPRTLPDPTSAMATCTFTTLTTLKTNQTQKLHPWNSPFRTSARPHPPPPPHQPTARPPPPPTPNHCFHHLHPAPFVPFAKLLSCPIPTV